MDSELDTALLTFESCHLVLESPIRLQIKLASIRSRSFLEFEEWHLSDVQIVNEGGILIFGALWKVGWGGSRRYRWRGHFQYWKDSTVGSGRQKWCLQGMKEILQTAMAC